MFKIQIAFFDIIYIDICHKILRIKYNILKHFGWIIGKLVLVLANKNAHQFWEISFYEINQQMILPLSIMAMKNKTMWDKF